MADRMKENEAFVAVVQEGGFGKASEKLSLSKAQISKLIASLEKRLGVSLLMRTTRQRSLTDIGKQYYEASLKSIRCLDDAEEIVRSAQSEPTGVLRISAAVDFGVNVLSYMLVDFKERYPKVCIELGLQNRYVEIISEEYDAAIRIGKMSDSSLRARKIATIHRRLIASPTYLNSHSLIAKIDDLNDSHQFLHHSNQFGGNVWSVLTRTGKMRQIRVNAKLTINDGQALLNAAINDAGIAYLPDFLYAEALKSNLVSIVLPDYPADSLDVSVVYPGSRYMSPKVRAFIDFLVEAFAKEEKTPVAAE